MPESTDMTPTDEFEAWTEADEAFLRGELASLRDDLDPHAMPEPALIRARVNRERRGGRRTWTLAAVAAAAAVAVAVVWNPLAGDDGTRTTIPGTTTSQTSSSATATQDVFPDEGGLLPITKEWQAILGEPFTATDVTEGPECGGPGRLPLAGQTLMGAATGVQGGQYVWNFGDAAGAAEGFDQMAAGLEDCSPIPIMSTRQPDPDGSNPLGGPRVYRYSAEGTDGGWFVLTRVDAFVTLIQVNPKPGVLVETTLDQARKLGEAAQLRLSSGGSTGETSQPSSGANACGDLTDVTKGLKTDGVNAAQAEKATKLADAVAACDTEALRAILTADRSEVSFGGLSVDQVLTLPANQDRYKALALLLTMQPRVESSQSLAIWPGAGPRTQAEWEPFIEAGVYTQAEVDLMLQHGSDAVWRVVIDPTGRVTAFIAGD